MTWKPSPNNAAKSRLAWQKTNGWFFVDRSSNIVVEAALCREFRVINKPVLHITKLTGQWSCRGFPHKPG
jgi:hypothetical protein